MKKPNELTDEEFTKLATAVAGLPFVKCERWKTDYLDDVCTTVLDFHMQSGVVDNALSYLRANVKRQHSLLTHHDLSALLSQYPNDKAGNTEAAIFLWGNKHWARIELLRRLLTFFESIGVTDQAGLHRWAKAATFERDFKDRVKGMGIAVFAWLQLRCGVETTLKPDVHVINFAKRVIGRKMSEKALIDVFSRVAPLVGETLATIDLTIWWIGKLSMATDDQPELRLIAWNMLKNELEEKLRKEVLSDFNWQLILEPAHRLRYDQSGLTIQPNRSLFGETVPGTTSACIRQSSWEKGLELEMMIRHDTSLPLPLFLKLQDNLVAQQWDVSNEPYFSASLDFEEDMKMTPAMTISELSDWVKKMIHPLTGGLRLISS